MIETKDQDNLESYIQDLKKAAVGNKKKTRFNGSQNRAIGGPTHPQLACKLFQKFKQSHPKDKYYMIQGFFKNFLKRIFKFLWSHVYISSILLLSLYFVY